MNENQIKLFEGKYVRLSQYPNFVLEGRILEVEDGAFVFETTQATSLISIENVKSIVELKRRH